MPLPFAVQLGLFGAAVAALSLALQRYRRLAVWCTGLMLPAFPLLADTSDWTNWFDWAKRYSVVVPTFLWAVLHDRPAQPGARWLVRAMPVVLCINVLEAAVFELQGPNRANGVLLAIVAVCGPWALAWDEPTRRYGFRNVTWQVAYMLTLARLYVLHPSIENITAAALLVLTLASLSCALARDTQPYLDWRVYTLYLVLLQDSLFPSWSDRLYPDWLHAERRAAWAGTTWAQAWLGLNAAAVAVLATQRVRDLVRWRRLGNISVSPAAIR